MAGAGRRDACRRCCRSCMTVVFSTLGLIVLIVTYTVLGGFLFRYLEEQQEVDRIRAARVRAQQIISNHSKALWNVTRQLNILHEANWTDEVDDILQQFALQINNLSQLTPWDGRADVSEEVNPEWTFPGALLFSLTAITTIGYGHVTPKTVTGQMITILYCIIGLPLTLMCLAKLGKAFAYVFRVIYYTCCCAACCLCCLATKSNRRRYVRRGSGVLSQPLSALVIGRNGVETMNVRAGAYRYSLGQIWCKRIKAKYRFGLDHKNAVPTSLCLLVMAAYIIGGALLFVRWEPNWEFSEGVYFCFITLTTIGFGDYVPGIDLSGSEAREVRNENLVLCALYVFIGLAFIGMCIDLMQVDVINKVKWMAGVLGLSNSKKRRRTHSDRKKAQVGLKLSSDQTSTMSKSATNSSLTDRKEYGGSRAQSLAAKTDGSDFYGSIATTAITVRPYLVSTDESPRPTCSMTESSTPLLLNQTDQSEESVSSKPFSERADPDGSYDNLKEGFGQQSLETVIG